MLDLQQAIVVAINNDIFLLRNDDPKDLIHKLIDMVY